MGSIGNQNPWAPYDSYKDCTQGVCSIYCPQWCYILFPPPPTFDLPREDDSATDFSPLIIALIGILASAFVLISYYTIVSKFCRRRNGNGNDEDDNDRSLNGSTDQVDTSMQVNNGNGLDDVVIKSITVYKYKKGDVVLVDCTDCSVCLSEFEEDESLRLLPKCNHAFHMLCIDSWLKSHSSCPLCRANISMIHRSDCTTSLPETTHGGDAGGGGGGSVVSVSSAFEYQNRNDSVSIIHDLESGIGVQNLLVVHDAPPKTTSSRAHLEIENAGTRIDRSDHAELPFRRSVSPNSSFCPSLRVSIADVLLASVDDEDVDDDDDDDEGDSRNSTGTGSSEQSNNGEESLSKNEDENGGLVLP